MTKEQASDLTSLIERVVENEKTAVACQKYLLDARQKLADYLHMLQQA